MSTNKTSDTTAAQQSGAAISSATDSKTATTAAAQSANDTVKSAADSTDGTTAVALKTTATSVKAADQQLDSSTLTSATANTYASLQQMKTATAGMTQEELISYVSAHNNAAKAANGGTIFVVSNSGDLVQMSAKAESTYVAKYTYKSTDGTVLKQPETKSTLLNDAQDALIEPPFIPGYQLDLNGSTISVYNGMDQPQSISSYINSLNSIQSSTFAQLFTKKIEINSFPDLLDAIGAMLGVQLHDSGLSILASMFGATSPTASQTGTFDYVYKKADSTIVTKDQTVNVGDPVPALNSFITSAKDGEGNDITSKLTSPDYTSLSTQTPGAKQVTFEYFNIENLEFIQAQATLNVVDPKTTDVISVNDKTMTYGDDVNGKGSDIGLTVSDSGTDLTLPSLTASDYTIMGAQYTASGHLAAGTYQVKLSNDGLKKVSMVNSNFVIDPVANFKAGTLTVNKATATFTATPASKVAGTADPTLSYTVTGAAKGDSLTATVTRAAGDKPGDYTETVTPSNLDTANYTAKTVPATFKITAQATKSTISLNNSNVTYGVDGDYGIKATATGSDIKIPTLSKTDFTIANATYSVGGHLNVGTYTTELSASGISKIAAANPSLSLPTDAYGTGTLTVYPAPVTLSTAQGFSKVINTPDPTFVVSVSGEAPKEKVEYTVSRTPGESVGKYTVTPTPVPDSEINKNYTFKVISGPFNITTASTDVSISVTNTSVEYGDIKVTNNTPGAVGTNYNFGVSFTGTLPAGTMPTLTASDYTIINANVTSSGYLAVNTGAPIGYMVYLTPAAMQKIIDAFPDYHLNDDAFSVGLLTVNPKTVHIAANSATKVFGTADPTYSYTSSSPLLDNANVTYTRTPGENVGTYDLTAKAADDSNYNFVYEAGAKLTITQAPVTDALYVGTTQMVYGESLNSGGSKFVLSHDGSQLTIPAIPQSDFSIVDGQYTNGRLNAGTYAVELNADG